MTTAAPTIATPPTTPPWAHRLAAAWRRHRGWLWTDVLAVFLITRLALLAIVLFAGAFPNDPNYPLPGVAARGWQFTPIHVLDVWGRWDTGWYFDIITNGYHAPDNLRTEQSNLAFFPLYPYLVRALTTRLPFAWQNAATTMLSGVLVSNAFLVGGLVLLRQWVAKLLGDEAVARRTVLYLLLFPTGFFFSAFYTESTFLFFAGAALYAAQRRAWFWAGLAGALLTLSRPLGILIGVPLVWEYAAAAQWNWRNARWNSVWFLLMPAAFLAFSYGLYRLTGDPLATVHARQAWARGLSWPWETLLHPTGGIDYITPLEQVLTVGFIGGALLALRRLPAVSLGLWALLLIAPPLFTGQLLSTTRYYMLVLPVFVVLAQLGKHATVDKAIRIIFPMLQALMFLGWCLFYWAE